MDRSVRLVVEAQVRQATERDMPALATWSGHVEDTFRPALGHVDRVLLVAVANGRFPIGHLLVDLHGVLSHLLVLAGFRDQGLGTCLIAEGERLLRERGVDRAALEVEKTNTAAIRLYERLGYVTAGDTMALWNEPTADGTMQAVEHPSWIMRKGL
jgi:ribosomal protein S18 acetylase RimI-like enzyme